MSLNKKQVEHLITNNCKKPERYCVNDDYYVEYKIESETELADGKYAVGIRYDYRDQTEEVIIQELQSIHQSCLITCREQGFYHLLEENELESLESLLYIDTIDSDRPYRCVNRESLKKQISELGITATVEEKGRPVVVHFPTHDLVIPEGTPKQEIAALLLEAANK